MIPCRECLVLAVCRQKEEIECGELHDWIETHRNVAAEVLRYLPNWLIVIKVPRSYMNSNTIDVGVPCFRRSR